MTQPLETLTQWVTDLASPDEHVRDETALSGLIDAVLGDDPVADDTARAIYDHALRDQGPLPGVGPPGGAAGVFGRRLPAQSLATRPRALPGRAAPTRRDAGHPSAVLPLPCVSPSLPVSK